MQLDFGQPKYSSISTKQAVWYRSCRSDAALRTRGQIVLSAALRSDFFNSTLPSSYRYDVEHDGKQQN